MPLIESLDSDGETSRKADLYEPRETRPIQPAGRRKRQPEAYVLQARPVGVQEMTGLPSHGENLSRWLRCATTLRPPTQHCADTVSPAGILSPSNNIAVQWGYLVRLYSRRWRRMTMTIASRRGARSILCGGGVQHELAFSPSCLSTSSLPLQIYSKYYTESITHVL